MGQASMRKWARWSHNQTDEPNPATNYARALALRADKRAKRAAERHERTWRRLNEALWAAFEPRISELVYKPLPLARLLDG